MRDVLAATLSSLQILAYSYSFPLELFKLWCQCLLYYHNERKPMTEYRSPVHTPVSFVLQHTWQYHYNNLKWMQKQSSRTNVFAGISSANFLNSLILNLSRWFWEQEKFYSPVWSVWTTGSWWWNQESGQWKRGGKIQPYSTSIDIFHVLQKTS